MIPNDLLALAPADKTAIIAAIDTIRQKLNPNLLNLPNDEVKKHQNMGYSSSEFADIVMEIATQHSITIPGDVNFTKVQRVYSLRNDLISIKNNKTDIDSLIDNLIMVAGIILMPILNSIYLNAARITEKGDYDFNDLVKQAGKRYVKGPRSQGTGYKITAASEATINKVIPGELFINDGTTILKFTCSNVLSGKLNTSETVTVLPGNSKSVPAGYTTIVVFNASTDTEGSFIVKQKK